MWEVGVTIGVGIIGAGVMGMGHARILASGMDGVELVAIQDINQERARSAAEECRARKAFDDPEKLISDVDVDAIVVVSPDDTHARLVMACIRAGKPVLCEKPLAATIDECRTIIDAEMAAGRRLVQVGYMRRFDPGYLAMREKLISGTYGSPVFLHCVHRNAVAPHFITSDMVITNAGVHEIDISRFLLEQEIVAVSVISSRAPGKAPRRQPQLVVLETDRQVVIYIELYLDAGYGYDVRAEAVCEDGTVALSPTPPIAVRQNGLEGFHIESDWRVRFGDAYTNQMRAWLNSIQAGTSVGSSAWDGYIASKTAQACLSALKTCTRIQIQLEQTPPFYR